MPKSKNLQQLNTIVSFKGALIKKLMKGMIFITLITVCLCLIHSTYPEYNLQLSAALPGYMGAALGLLLVFRNNTAYEKWWEARKEVGALVNTCRNLGITINGILPPHNKDKDAIANLTVAFVYALKEHLRTGVKMELIKNLDKEDYDTINKADHRPNVIVNLMMNKIEHLYIEKHITDIQQYLLAKHINGLIDILGKCERIRNTPIPMAYGFLLKFFISLYVIILPLGIINDLGWWSIPMVMMLYYILMSIVLTAEEIEEPFGKDMNDLQMDKIADNIRNNINEIVLHH